MPDQIFIAGQRWISDTEANLGLGIVVETAARRVVLSFPAAGEKRTYAMDNAPVSRVRYEVGDRVTSADEWSMVVSEVEELDGYLVYKGLDTEGIATELPELELSAFVQFNTPQARLFAGQIDHNKRFELRYETLRQLRRHQQSPVSGLLGARVQLLPHQLYIAHETANRYAPRVLLADEVGLGKTIEAGLITHQQLVSGRAKRVLIVVPENLVHQWLVEMLRRFNLHFTILDEDRCEAIRESGDNPFDTSQLVLCSLPFLTQAEGIQEQALASEWDLLLVDEAHHLQWSEQEMSHEYSCIESLARITKGLLLLTATPEQLGMEGHFARLRLLDPDRYYDLARFREEEASYQAISELVQAMLEWLEQHENSITDAVERPGNMPELLDGLQRYLGTEAVEPLQQVLLSESNHTLEEVIPPLINALLDHHGTGRVLFRNTRDNVQGFPERQLVEHPLSAPEQWSDLQAGATQEALLYPEQLLDEEWVQRDTRVSWLADWLSSNREEKVLVICASSQTALALEEYLRLRVGLHSAVFHEGLDLVARDRAAAYFADAEEGAQVLICSEIGSEGRNFQFSHHLVLFDLPINPDLLEQRIGRLDRIGQRHAVKIHVPCYEGSAQAILLRWYNEGINCFERTSAAGQAIFQAFRERLENCLSSGTDVDSLVDDTRVMAENIQLQMQQGRDQLLEMNSCDPERAAEIVVAIKDQERGHQLSDYMDSVFEQFGVDQERHSAISQVLHPGDHMRCAHFPALPEGGVTVTYQREYALSREDVQFITWEHPMVVGAMDLVLNEDFGNTALATIKLPPLKPGTLLLEAVFAIHCPAPAELQLSRYLPMTTVRAVVDKDGKDFTQVLTHERLNQRVERVKRVTARELVRHAQPQLTEMVEQVEQMVKPQQDKIVGEAIDEMRSAQNAELARLTALSRVNPNIRQQEIDMLQADTESLSCYLQNAQLKLDALRVIVAI